MQRPWSSQSNISYVRYLEKCFTQIYRALFGEAMLVPIQMGTNMVTESNRNICH